MKFILCEIYYIRYNSQRECIYVYYGNHSDIPTHPQKGHCLKNIECVTLSRRIALQVYIANSSTQRWKVWDEERENKYFRQTKKCR